MAATHEAPSSSPLNVEELEHHAQRTLPHVVFDYYVSGSMDEHTLRENHTAFTRIPLSPRVLVDVSSCTTETTVLGSRVATPIMFAPTAMQCMAHADGECATARAALKEQTLMVLSSWATRSIEEVAAAAPGGLRWFQLYVYKDRNMVQRLVQRAEQAGYHALCLTVDTPVLGRRERDVRNNFALPKPLSLANFTEDRSELPQKHSDSGLAAYVASQIDRSLNWNDVRWLQSITRLPIVVKGILCVRDAALAVKHGVAGIVVSNHGARQLDTVPATIDVLEEVVREVNGKVEVFLDGGIRRGTDVLKALALGARAVLVGRPVLWGLAYDGEKGVRLMMNLLREEFKLAMMLAGCGSLADITPQLIKRDLWSRL